MFTNEITANIRTVGSHSDIFNKLDEALSKETTILNVDGWFTDSESETVEYQILRSSGSEFLAVRTCYPSGITFYDFHLVAIHTNLVDGSTPFSLGQIGTFMNSTSPTAVFPEPSIIKGLLHNVHIHDFAPVDRTAVRGEVHTCYPPISPIVANMGTDIGVFIEGTDPATIKDLLNKLPSVKSSRSHCVTNKGIYFIM